MKYYVKTRNWYCNMRVFKLLQLVPCQRGDSYNDGDAKLYHETNSLTIALAIWCYWKLLNKWSGGWTYVCDQHKHPYGLSGSYKSFYL